MVLQSDSLKLLIKKSILPPTIHGSCLLDFGHYRCMSLECKQPELADKYLRPPYGSVSCAARLFNVLVRLCFTVDILSWYHFGSRGYSWNEYLLLEILTYQLGFGVGFSKKTTTPWLLSTVGISLLSPTYIHLLSMKSQMSPSVFRKKNCNVGLLGIAISQIDSQTFEHRLPQQLQGLPEAVALWSRVTIICSRAMILEAASWNSCIRDCCWYQTWWLFSAEVCVTGFWTTLVWETAVSETLLVFGGESIICKRAPGTCLGRPSLCQGDGLPRHVFQALYWRENQGITSREATTLYWWLPSFELSKILCQVDMTAATKIWPTCLQCVLAFPYESQNSGSGME